MPDEIPTENNFSTPKVEKNPFACKNYVSPKERERLRKAKRKITLASRPQRPKPPPPPKPPPTLSMTKFGRLRPVEGEISSDMISNLLDTENIKEFLAKSSPRDKSRVAALLYTLYSAKKVGLMMALSAKQVHRYYEKHITELQSAMQVRNSVIAGLAERRAIEALQRLDVNNIPDERKARAVKDLVDSAAVVREALKPPEQERDENIMELIFRVKQRGQQVHAKTVDAEFLETATP